jgi:hypothetical protein
MKKTYLLILSVLFAFNSIAQYPYGILPERSNMKQDAYDAWVLARDNHLDNSGTADPQNMLRHKHNDGITYQEYQSFAIMTAIYNSDWDAFHKLWNYTKHIASINTFGNPPVRHLQPWKSNANSIIGKGMSFETADMSVALYEAAVRDPSAVDADGQPFMELAGNAADEHWRIHICHDPAPGIAGGARWKCGSDGFFIYLHYASPWGYFQRFADASGNNKWIEPYTYNGTQYKAADQAIREIFLKHIRDYNYETFCHTMLINGEEAGANGSDDAGSLYFGWGQARGLIKNAMTYCNWGHPDDYEICKYMADFFVNHTGNDPTNIQNGYNCIDASGGGDPKPSMVGAAGLICMIDEQYQDFVNACWDWMVANIGQWSSDYRESLQGACYMAAMAGQMNLRLANNENYIDLSTNSMSFENSGGNQSFDIISDLSWNITTSDSWFSVNTNSGSNNATIDVSVDPNGTNNSRTGSITVENTTEGINKTITITQLGPTFTLTVNNGTGGGDYGAGEVIEIIANDPQPGYLFDKWTGDVTNIANVNASTTTIEMGANNAEITATYAETNDIILQAEDADVLNSASVETAYSGYNGSGYVKFGGGAYFEFTDVAVPAGTFDVVVRSIEDWADASQLIVNGTTYDFELPGGGEGTTEWMETTISGVVFQSSGNTIRISDGKQQKIDQIKIAGIITGNCSPKSIIQKEKIIAYPNPVTDDIVNFKRTLDADIYSITGEKILSVKNTDEMNLSGLDKGVYILNMYSTDGLNKYSKLIIE